MRILWLRLPLPDFQVGDFVRRRGRAKGVGWIEELSEEDATAVVGFDIDKREILHFYEMKRTKPCGHGLDRRS